MKKLPVAACRLHFSRKKIRKLGDVDSLGEPVRVFRSLLYVSVKNQESHRYFNVFEMLDFRSMNLLGVGKVRVECLESVSVSIVSVSVWSS